MQYMDISSRDLQSRKLSKRSRVCNAWTLPAGTFKAPPLTCSCDDRVDLLDLKPTLIQSSTPEIVVPKEICSFFFLQMWELEFPTCGFKCLTHPTAAPA
ncbi:unnamed protein product, partial [Ilex paraguariensis]